MTRTVYIGAGHGIHTRGKRTPDGEREWTFNTKVVEEAIKQLEYNGFKVVRTDDPTGNKDIPLHTRTNRANRGGADVYISVHHNALKGYWGNWGGTETFHYRTSSNGKRLASIVHKEMLNAYGLQDRGLKTSNLHITRETDCPAILIEGGFMDSRKDIQKMRSDAVLKNAGVGVARGVCKYFGVPFLEKTDVEEEREGFYRVITGSFLNSKKNAQTRVKELKDKGFDSFIVKFRKGNKVYFRVVTGSFKGKNKKNAQTRVKELKDKGFDSFIVKYDK